VATVGDSRPVLWQLQISHYNEKVRWALDYKGVEYERRSLLPGFHKAKTKRLTGDVDTTPVLTLDGRSIGDSTAIIAAIEERWPQPPLYPADPAERERALALEDFFDEELGPHIRRAAYHELLDHPKLLLPIFLNEQGFFSPASLPRPRRAAARSALPRWIAWRPSSSRVAISSETRSASPISPLRRSSTRS
jgi:glutathione S-transferase